MGWFSDDSDQAGAYDEVHVHLPHVITVDANVNLRWSTRPTRPRSRMS